jgi:hypothetical protein
MFVIFMVVIFFDLPQKADAIVFNDIASAGREYAESIAKNQQKVVVDYFGGGNAAFSYLCYCAQIFAVFPAALGVMRWFREDEDLKIWLELLAPILVLIALSNGGYILGQIILALYKIFDAIINEFDSYTGFYKLIKEGKAIALAGQSISPIIKQCEALIGAEQAQCFADAAQQAQSLLGEYKQDFGNAEWIQDWLTRLGDLGGKLLDSNTNVLDKVRTAFWTITSPAWEGILMLILASVMAAWQALYGIAFIFAGLAAPMAATASLFTPNSFLSSAYMLWLTGIFAIFLARLLLYVGYGLASDMIVSADTSTDILWFGVLMALILPFVVFSIAKGSAAGVWSSLVGVGTSAISIGAMIAGGAIAGPAGAAAAGSATSAAPSSVSTETSPPPSGVRVETQY